MYWVQSGMNQGVSIISCRDVEADKGILEVQDFFLSLEDNIFRIFGGDRIQEAFAVVLEASKRVLGLRPFDVQLIGAMVLHKGEIAEMSTGGIF
ncbi:hypothetical protein SUGI_0282170 [Cryptomeria japonica]|nr:hypothetical protein SUGI_0282170 [Cryptomeria japonica]